MKKTGFTLIEILIVLVIVSFFGLIGVRSFINYEESIKEIGEVQELVDDLRYAKQMAIAKQVHYSIVFDFENNSYLVVKEEDGGQTIKEKSFPKKIRLEPVDEFSKVKFTRFGAVFQSGEVALRDSSTLRKIIIKPSGFINVQRNNLN